MLLARIAVVEDDIDVSRTIRDMLRESGHEVISYLRPSWDIIEHLKTLRPDLVIVDARLNESVTGWDIIHALRDGGDMNQIPVIVCSGAVDQIAQNRDWLNAEGVPVLRKPFALDELESLVDRMLVH